MECLHGVQRGKPSEQRSVLSLQFSGKLCILHTPPPSRRPIVPSCLCVWGGRHCLSPLHHLPPSPPQLPVPSASGLGRSTPQPPPVTSPRTNGTKKTQCQTLCGVVLEKERQYTTLKGAGTEWGGGDHPANIGIPENTARTEATWPLLTMLAVNNQTDLSHLQLSAPGNRQSRDSLNTTRISVLPLSGTASNLLVLWVRQVVQHLPFNPFIYYWKSLPPPPSLVFGK